MCKVLGLGVNFQKVKFLTYSTWYLKIEINTLLTMCTCSTITNELIAIELANYRMVCHTLHLYYIEKLLLVQSSYAYVLSK